MVQLAAGRSGTYKRLVCAMVPKELVVELCHPQKLCGKPSGMSARG